MNFPYIENINDVLPHINNYPEFSVREKDGYIVIDYHLSSNETFRYNEGKCFNSQSYLYRRECRGIKFNSEGKLIGRGFQKFFNLMEGPENHIDILSQKNIKNIMVKMDGSCIWPFYVNDEIRWGTRAGVTDVSMQAEKFVKNNPKYNNFARYILDAGFTPIFEWTSRQQRIVLDYPQDNLTLLAIRKMDTGEYIPYNDLYNYKTINIPVVKSYKIQYSTIHEIADHIKNVEDMEGVVIRFEDDHLVKSKSEWYTTIHHAKDGIKFEKDLLKCILSNGIDDLLPFLDEDTRNRAEMYRFNLVKDVDRFSTKVYNEVLRIEQLYSTKKDFAINYIGGQGYADFVRNFVFKYWGIPFSKKDVTSYVEELLLNKACGSLTAVNDYRYIISSVKW